MCDRNNITGVKKENCYGCYACYNICPIHVIQMKMDEEGFAYPNIDKDQCINCGKCVQVCPSCMPIHLQTTERAYACYAKDNTEHISSSSGGFFSVLAKQVLEQKGRVFGTAFNERLEVEHIEISKVADLFKLKGSKYVQSKIGNIYLKVKEQLEDGKIVLFSGTPCQIVGLKLFLKKEYEKLVCVDLICHGVASPAVWDGYLNEQFGENEVVEMSFRDKKSEPGRAILKYKLKNGTIYRERYHESPYIQGFISNYYTRQVCFECGFKGFKRWSDITIGDFWSIKEFHPELYHENGVSAVITHTSKGEKWMNSVADKLIMCDSTTDEISVWNECILESVKRNPLRQEFFEKWDGMSVKDVITELNEKKSLEVNKFEKKRIFRKIIGKTKKWLV